MEAHNTNSVNWAHRILDAEEDLGISLTYLPEDPFDIAVTRLEPINQTYRRSIRSVLICLIRRADKISEARRKKFGTCSDGTRRAHYAELLSRYDTLVLETNFREKQLEAARAAEAASVLNKLDIGEAAKIKKEIAKIPINVRHYFTRCELGRIVVNYE